MELPEAFPRERAEEAHGALRAASRAASVLMDHWRAGALPETKADGSPVSAADRAADAAVRSELEGAFPDDGLLSEEVEDDGRRLDKVRVWIVDPLDGTRDFLQGSEDFSVHVGFTMDGAPSVGVVHAPTSDTVWLGVPGVGAWVSMGGSRWTVRTVSGPGPALRVAVPRRELGPRTRRLRELLPEHVVVRRGGCGIKAALVVDDAADVYAAVTRSLKEWDLCAPHAIAAGAGAVCTDVAGGTLSYNSDDVTARRGFVVAAPWTRDLLRPVFDQLAGELDQ